MANSEDKRLAVDVIARIDKLEKGMAKAAAVTKSGSAQMERASDRARARIEANFSGMRKSAAAFAKNLAAPLVALGAAGVIRAVGDVARGIAEISDEARRAGVSIEAFQELKHVAEQNRIGVDSLVDGLKELNLRADEFVTTGAGSAAEAFQRIGYNAATLKEKLADPSALFTEIIGKLGQLDQAAAIRIADEIFGGTGGEKFVQLIDQGEAGIKRSIEQARTLGLVMNQDVVDKAIELDQKFNLVANTVGTALKGAIVEAATALDTFISSFRAFEDQSTAALEARLAALDSAKNLPNPLGLPTDIFGVDAAEREKIMAELKRRAVNNLRTGLAALGQGGGENTLPPSGLSVPTSAQMADAEAVLKLIDALEHEQAQLGRTAREQAIYNALHQAGSTATAEQRARIEELVGANFDLAASQEKVAEATQAVMDTAESTFRGMVDDLIAGKDAADIFANALGNIANQLVNMGMNSLFGGGGLFSGLFGTIAGGAPIPSGGFIPGITGPRLFADGGIAGPAATRNHPSEFRA